MHLQINTTITRSTLGEFDDFVELVKKNETGHVERVSSGTHRPRRHG